MRSDKYNKKNIKNKHSKLANINQKSKRKQDTDKSIKKDKVKPMSDGRRKFIKIFNTVFVFAYLIFSIYVMCNYFNWRSLVLPMMKNESSIVVDSNENTLETIGSERKKSNVKLSYIPDNLKNAYIDIEDERFYSHKGVDLKRTTAAIGSYVIHFGKSSFGGSSITQQLVKNLTGNNDNSISRKMEEWVKAVELETFCSKDEILESYFNIIYLAPNTYGVDAAAKYYFDKNVKDLDLAECAFLAGINNSPNSYNPFNEKDNSDRIKKRSKLVLNKMLELKHISQDDYNNAIQEVEHGLNFKNGEFSTVSNGIYSYHTDAMISEVISDISKKKHIDSRFATNYVYMAGIKIYSTENTEIQKKLEEEYNKNKYILTSSKTGNKTQSAMVVIDHTNGQVLGCVGGLGEKTTSRGFNRATQAYRQTGSATKPIAVLIPGISEKVFTPATLYTDEPTTFQDGTEDGYSPTDNDDYIGEITVRRALESSQNIPFVKMMEQITPKTSIKYLKKMGISSLTDKDESLMLALGGLEKGITPLEMAGAYATIANNGTYIEPTFYTKIVNSNGKEIIKTNQKKTKVISEEVAYIIKKLLEQPVEGENGTAKACKIEGMDVAAKTGTTNENYDKWLCGFTTYYTAVTWYGYDISETIEYKGKSPAVMIWSNVMKNIHSSLEKTRFEENSKVKQATICAKFGKTAVSNCSNTYTEYFLPGTVPDQCTSCTAGNKKKNNNTNKVNQTNTVTNNTVNNIENNVTNNIKNNSIENKTNTVNTAKNEIPKNEVNKNNIANNIINNTTNNAKNEIDKNQKNNVIENNTVNNIKNNTVEPDDEQDDGP